MTTTTRTSPITANSDLCQTTSGRFYVETILTCSDFQELKAWTVAKQDEIRARGGRFLRWSDGTYYRCIGTSQWATSSRNVYQARIGYAVEDQEAAAKVSTGKINGTYHWTYSNTSPRETFRRDLRALIGQ